MLVSKSSFEPRGTGSRRSTTPSHGNMRLRPSSTETWKRVLLVPPTKIMFTVYCLLNSVVRVLYASQYALLCFLCNLISAFEKKNRKKRKNSLLSESNSPKDCSFRTTSSLTSSSMKKYNDDKEKSGKKKGRNSPARVKTPRTRTPFVRSFAASFHSSAIFTFHRYKKKRLICASPREKANDEEKSSQPSTLYHR